VIHATVADQHRGDYKSFLQEQAQALVRITPIYRIISEKGHEHEKLFTAQAVVGEQVIGQGVGRRSKKEAEQAAAQDALPALPSFFPREVENCPGDPAKRGTIEPVENAGITEETFLSIMIDSNEPRADIGVFGGSGFYSLLDNVREVALETPFGPAQ